MDELTTSIVGIDFPNADKSRSNRRMEILMCAPGDPVTLRREPKNPHDPNAIGVWSLRDIQMGYISAERAPLLGRRMQAEPVVAVFQAMMASGAYVRIRFGGGEPTLPPMPDPDSARIAPAVRRGRDADGFYPDDDGPEWGA